MTIKPFLSHRRENSTAVEKLRDSLRIYGAGGWKDTDDLHLGDRTQDGIRRAIFEETGGFIWWGTRAALESTIINTLEIPTAFERKEAEALYPVIPLFIDIDPGNDEDRQAIRSALGCHADELLECNGLALGAGEPAREFRRRVARRYVRDTAKALTQRGDGSGPIKVAMRALSESSGDHDLTFDWRELLDDRERTLHTGSIDLIKDALASSREAFQAAFRSPEVNLDVDLPLPLSFLVGCEWRLTTRLRLVVGLRTGSASWELSGEGDSIAPEEPGREPLRGHGPAVFAVSCRDGFGQAARRYATRVDARELINLHVPGVLEAPALRGLARATARELGRLNGRGVEKHLLMLGPSGLAVFAGAAANATGPVTLPFWNGDRYVDGVVATA